MMLQFRRTSGRSRFLVLLSLVVVTVLLCGFLLWSDVSGRRRDDQRLLQEHLSRRGRLRFKNRRVLPRIQHAFHSRVVTKDLHYGVVVDCGSTGSRLFVYAWPTHSGDARELLDIRPLADKHMRPVVRKVTPGLSSLAFRPAQAPHYLSPLLDYASEEVPADKHRETPLYIMATAGMRMIPMRAQRAILSELRRNIPLRYNFQFSESHVEIISGKQEGVYGWLATNYLLGRFGHPERHHQASEGLLDTSFTSVPLVPVEHDTADRGGRKHVHIRPRTVGVIDMGGGSFQVAFEVPREQASRLPDDLVAQFNLGCRRGDAEHTYTIYVTTYLGFGANAARSRYEEMLARSVTAADPISTTTTTTTVPNESTARRNSSRLLGRRITKFGLGKGRYWRNRSPLSTTGRPPVAAGDPCLPPGMTMRTSGGQRLVGKGNFKLCLKSVLPLLNSTVPCEMSPCTLNGRHQPKIDFIKQEFFGFSEYWYTTSQVLHVGGIYDYRKLYNAATGYCGTSWRSIQQKFIARLYPQADAGRMREQCFKSAWITAVLHHGLGFPLNYRHFTSVQSISGAEVQWTLGAMLYRTRYFPLREVQRAKFERLKRRRRKKRLQSNYQYWLLLVAVLVVLVLVAAKLHIVPMGVQTPFKSGQGAVGAQLMTSSSVGGGRMTDMYHP